MSGLSDKLVAVAGTQTVRFGDSLASHAILTGARVVADAFWWPYEGAPGQTALTTGSLKYRFQMLMS